MRQSRQPLRLPPIRIMEYIIRFYLITARHEPIADSQLAFSHSNCRRRRRMATRASSDGNVLNSQPGVVFFPFRRFDSRPDHASRPSSPSSKPAVACRSLSAIISLLPCPVLAGLPVQARCCTDACRLGRSAPTNCLSKVYTRGPSTLCFTRRLPCFDAEDAKEKRRLPAKRSVRDTGLV
jgi:hypothetical protein